MLPKKITISQDGHYLATENGDLFMWLADTWWYGMTSRMSISTFEELCQLRKRQGFNVIQIVIGIPPETELFGADSKNSGGAAVNKDLTLNESYFDEVQQKLDLLYKYELVPCIVGSWGHHIDVLGVPVLKNLWSKIIQIVGDRPAVYCLCGEADIFPPTSRSLISRIIAKLTPKRSNTIEARLAKWNTVAEHIKSSDPSHLLTVHIQSRTSARKLFQNPSWLDINSIQSGHSYDSLKFMISEISTESSIKMPILNLEPWYEGIRDSFYGSDQLLAFWACLLSGAAGHSYGAHGIWQMSSNDNFQGHWGNSDWRSSIKYDGAQLVGKAATELRAKFKNGISRKELKSLVPPETMIKLKTHLQ